MVVEVDVIIIRAFPSLYHFHLVTPAARRWVKKNVKEQHGKTVKVLEVERKFAWDVAYGIQNRSIVVASEFDLLQLQSLAARLAQLEGLKPQAGYLKATAVGDGSVDAATVRALGQLPLVMRNGGNSGTIQ
jgi:hypothetical protein